MARHEKQRRETTDEFCKRLGIVQVKGAKGGVEFLTSHPLKHGVRSQRVSDDEPEIDEITRTLIRECVDYGVSSDAGQIPALFALYREWIDTSSVAKRLEVLQVITATIERHRGSAILALMPFIIAETESPIISTAALNLCVLHPAEDNPLDGPSFLSSVLAQSPTPDRATGAALGGMMLLGDERVSGLIREIWEDWPPEARQEAVRQRSPLVSKGHIELLLEFLGSESDLDTYGCIAAALANLAVGAERDGVFEVERVFPAWSAPDEPLKFRRRWSRNEFATEIRSRLDQLIETEPAGPNGGMIMPVVLQWWLGNFG